MPSKSKKQQRLFGQAWAVRKGELSKSDAWPSAVKIADSDISDKDLLDFATTVHDGLPEKKRKKKRVKESYVKTFESFTNRIMIGDLDQKISTNIKNAILNVIAKNLPSYTRLPIFMSLGDVAFDAITLNVEEHGQAMYEITDVLEISNEYLANIIKDELIKAKNEDPTNF